MSSDCSQPRVVMEIDPPHPVMIALLLVMSAIFVLQTTVPPCERFALHYLALNATDFLGKWRLWQAVTALFLHGGLWHFGWNMVFLYLFGNPLLHGWRRGEFLRFFLVCGVSSAICFWAVSRTLSPSAVGLGASGAIFGLMAAYGMVFGERQVLAFFVIPLKARTFVLILLVVSAVLLVASRGGQLAEVAHLSGALVGYLYLKLTWHLQNRQAGLRRGKCCTGNRIGGLEVMDHDAK